MKIDFTERELKSAMQTVSVYSGNDDIFTLIADIGNRLHYNRNDRKAAAILLVLQQGCVEDCDDFIMPLLHYLVKQNGKEMRYSLDIHTDFYDHESFCVDYYYSVIPDVRHYNGYAVEWRTSEYYDHEGHCLKSEKVCLGTYKNDVTARLDKAYAKEANKAYRLIDDGATWDTGEARKFLRVLYPVSSSYFLEPRS